MEFWKLLTKWETISGNIYIPLYLCLWIWKDRDIKTILKELQFIDRDNLDEDSQTLLNIIDSLTGKYDKAPEGMKDEEEDAETENSL